MAERGQGRVVRRGDRILLTMADAGSSIRISNRALGALPDALGGRPAAAIIDATVWRRHRGILAPLLESTGCRGRSRLILPGGESVKTPENLVRVWRRLASAALPRDGVVIGVGGGTILDLAGFAAATWMRGSALISVPTTLLAAADASVGGKTAVDLDGLKNPVGAFHAAETVLIDPVLLATLPRREWRCGLAEIVKTAVISDPRLFRDLEAAADDLRSLLDRGPAAARVAGVEALPWDRWLTAAVTAKARIVAADYREQGPRRALNLGHTLAHALEPLLDLPHGEAVSLGLCAVTRAAAVEGLCPHRASRRIIALLDACGLPTTCPPPPLEAVARYVLRDKKSASGTVGWVVPASIGRVTIDHPWPLPRILPFLAE